VPPTFSSVVMAWLLKLLRREQKMNTMIMFATLKVSRARPGKQQNAYLTQNTNAKQRTKHLSRNHRTKSHSRKRKIPHENKILSMHAVFHLMDKTYSDVRDDSPQNAWPLTAVRFIRSYNLQS
jgi:hypothetical protein